MESHAEVERYFAKVKGVGVLSTADQEGKVDAAIYSRPHFMEDGTLAFIMRDRLTHHNIQTNPNAVYLFKEEGSGYRGKRLFMTKVGEEKDSPLITRLVFASQFLMRCASSSTIRSQGWASIAVRSRSTCS